MMKTFKQFLNEGGGTFKGTSRINQENVEDTLAAMYKKILPVLKLKQKDVASIGSTGKKGPGESSGDIDIAVDATAIMKNHKVLTVADLFDVLAKGVGKVAPEIHPNTGLGVFSYLWPITNTDGLQENQFVQVDLMLSDNVEFSKWAYYSPFWKDTKYKGAIRNILLFSAVKHVFMDIKKRDDQGNPTEWEKYVFDSNKGLFKALQTNLGKKGTPTKTKRTLKKEFITSDIDKVIHMILGPKATRADTLSFETLLEFIKSNRFNRPDLRKKIIAFFKSEIQNKKMVLPSEID